MAGEAKLGAKAAEEVIDLLKQAKSGDQLETLATKTGFDVEALDDVVQKGVGKGGVKGGKDLLKSIVDKLGGTIESVQTEVNTLLGRTRDVGGGQVPPSAKGQVEITGPVDGLTRGKGFTMAPRVGEQGEALPVPVSTKQAGALEGQAVIEPEVLDSPRMTSLQTKMGRAAEDATTIQPRLALPEGQTEAAKMSQTPSQKMLEAATAPKPQQMSMAKKAAAAGLVGLGAGFSKEANAPVVIKESGIDKVEDVKGLADKAEAQGAVTPEQKAVVVQQVEQVAKAQKSLGEILQEEYKQDKARIELLRLTETIMNGLVTAIGANALLNRGSPYAVDFSKGPKTDWAGELDRLQKDFKIQMDALNEKYKLEAHEKQETEREARRKYEFEETQKLSREKLEAQKAKQSQAAGAAKTIAESKALEKQNKAYSQLLKAVENKKPGDVKRFGFEAGLPDEDIKAIKDEMGKGWFRKTYDSFEALLSSEEATTLDNILKKYRPGQQAAPAAPGAAAPADADRKRLEELRALKAAKQKGG
ncbi:hypothetical protein EBZ39_05750 [bacterium]|nr:hypothetical protein [bacterium]